MDDSALRVDHAWCWVPLHAVLRENRELRRANAILKTASAFFAAELDRTPCPRAGSAAGRVRFCSLE
jgi:transposase-like protein